MNQRRVAGIFLIRIDGKTFETSGAAKINFGQNMREAKVGTRRVVGYTEKPQAPSIECKLVLTQELRVIDLANVDGATISVDLPNGNTVVLRDAWSAGEFDYDSESGEVSGKFEGMKMEETKAA